MQELSSYEKTRRHLARELMSIGAVLTADSDHPLVVERPSAFKNERGFKLKLHEKKPNAPLSPFYLNLRTPDNPKRGPMTASLVDLAARHMWRLMLDVNMSQEPKITFDAVAGVPRAGAPYAEAFARVAGVHCLFLEKKPGTGKGEVMSLESPIPAGVRKVLVIDDVVTRAHSKLQAVDELRRKNLEVADVLVLVDRDEGGHDELIAWDCSLHSVFTLDFLLRYYVEEGMLDLRTELEIRAYHEQAA